MNKPRSLMHKIREREQRRRDADRLQVEIDGIREFISWDPAQRLVRYVKRNGSQKAHLVSLTPAQFRALLGYEPKACVLSEGCVPWEYALDHVADRLGYESDEHLQQAVEEAYAMRRELETLQTRLRALESGP